MTIQEPLTDRIAPATTAIGVPGIGQDSLTGFTVAVTADRRRDELTALLERKGARVVLAPALRIIPLADDSELRTATLTCIAHPPEITVVTTGIGLRGWLEAAEGWGLADALRGRLLRTTLIARGPKARGALRAAGLTDAWSPESESCDEMLDYLIGTVDGCGMAGGVAGRRIAVQPHGSRSRSSARRRAAGADVIESLRTGGNLHRRPLRGWST
jgi:uroporphyrinogen-III synthase